MRPPLAREGELAARLLAFLESAAPLLSARRGILHLAPVRSRDLSVTKLQLLCADLAEALPAAREAGTGVDVWSIIGLGRNEVQTARVLRWLLDPRGSHGAKDTYLASLWTSIGGEKILGFAVGDVLRVYRESYPLADAGSRIDIEVVGLKFLLFIEVKIGAQEGELQLERYQRLAQAKADNIQIAGQLDRVDWAVLYLTPGRPSPPGRNFLHLTWQTVAEAIWRAARQMDGNSYSTRLAVSFADHVARLR